MGNPGFFFGAKLRGLAAEPLGNSRYEALRAIATRKAPVVFCS